MLEVGGGPAANAACLLSLWGVSCGLATVLGGDTHGQKILVEFRAVGTDLSLTEIRPGHRTPVSVILVNLANGSRTLVNQKEQGAELRLDPARLTGWSPRVLLMGQAGAGYYERGQWVVVPAVPVARHVNATGCGDVLSVCMMLLHEQSHPKAKLSLANQIVAEFIEGRRNLVPALA